MSSSGSVWIETNNGKAENTNADPLISRFAVDTKEESDLMKYVKFAFCYDILMLMHTIELVIHEISNPNLNRCLTQVSRMYCSDNLTMILYENFVNFQSYHKIALSEIINNRIFYHLPSSFVAKMLYDPNLKCNSEYEVFKALIKWCSHDEKGRLQDLQTMLCLAIRLQNLTDQEYSDVITDLKLDPHGPIAEIVKLAATKELSHLLPLRYSSEICALELVMFLENSGHGKTFSAKTVYFHNSGKNFGIITSS